MGEIRIRYGLDPKQCLGWVSRSRMRMELKKRDESL